jgi:hypothetical protein
VTPHPTPSADGLVKAPDASRPLPKGEGYDSDSWDATIVS